MAKNKNQKAKKPTELISHDLRKFLTLRSNTVTREAILKRRFLYDMSLAAAYKGYALSIFNPDIDREGVDVVLADPDLLRPIQLKSSINRLNPSTPIADIHSSVLKPSIDWAERIGIWPTHGNIGQGGAIVFMEINRVDGPSLVLDIRYWFTDVRVLAALSRELVPHAPTASKDDAANLIQELHSSISNHRVTVPGSCFVPAASPGALLSLGGWDAPDPHSNPLWQNNLEELIRPKTHEEYEKKAIPGFKDAKTVNDQEDQAREGILRNGLKKLCIWPTTRGWIEKKI